VVSVSAATTVTATFQMAPPGAPTGLSISP
jgi:hypothetical protein